MSNQLTVKMVLDAWNAQVQNANKIISSLSDEQLMSDVAPNRNRGIYLLGHLAAVNDKIMPVLGFGAEAFPKWNELFLSTPDKSVTDMPTPAEVRNYWETSLASLTKHFNEISADDWFAKHSLVSAEDFAKEPHRNKLNIIISRTNHLAYHVGQLRFLKS